MTVTPEGRKNTEYGICNICEFPVEKQVSKKYPVMIHQDLIAYEARKLHAKQHMSLESKENKFIMYSEEHLVDATKKAVILGLTIYRNVNKELLESCAEDTSDVNEYDDGDEEILEGDVEQFSKDSVIYK